MPTRVLALVSTEFRLEPSECPTPHKRIGQTRCDIRMVDRRDKPPHLLIGGTGSDTTHGQPPIRIWVKLVRTPAEVQDLRRPDGSVSHVDVRRASTGLVQRLSQLVELDRQQQQTRHALIRIVLELGDEFGVTSPATLTQRIDQAKSNGDENLGTFGAKHCAASVLEPIDRHSTGQHSLDRSGVNSSNSELLQPHVTTHRPLPLSRRRPTIDPTPVVVVVVGTGPIRILVLGAWACGSVKREMTTPAAPTPADLSTTRVALYVSTATAVITTVTFGLALTAVPISGANCPGDCLEYPYLDTADRFPRDYFWMYPAIGLVIAYLLLMVSLRAVAPQNRSVIGQMAVAVSVVAAAVLVPTYFVQFSVVPSSIAAGETDGIALLTQYNPHGAFIALEEVGYLLMSVSFLLAIPLIDDAGVKARLVRWLFGAGFFVPIVALVAVALMYGVDRQDRFEVAAISVNWLVLIVNGILLASIFRDRLHADM